ncbi:MAG TPA: IS200/IS605 family transposase [Dehalococcoidia bacterium]|nr:IS200/IS605 family transposase [Dehalococcoidia bacterium]
MGFHYHVWFSTKCRKDAFEDNFGDEMKAILKSIAGDHAINLLELELVADHVHLLVELVEGQTLADLMHQLKGASARFIFLKYPELKIDMKSRSFWQKGYGRRWVPRDPISVVRRYIRTQRDRPYRRF